MRGRAASGEQRAGGRTIGACLARLVLPALLAVPCALLPASDASAQTRRVEILNADRVEVETGADGGVVRRLAGNVRLRQDTTALRADRAVYDERRGEVVLTGGVHVVSGRDTLTAAEVVYDADAKVATARGAVRVGTPDATLFAPEVRYDSRAEVSAFAGGGRLLHRGAVLTAPTGTYSSASRLARTDGPVALTDSAGTLTAARGRYDTRAERADFAGDVRLARPDARLAADSLVYFRTTERARAYGHVAMERLGDGRREASNATPPDSTQRTLLFGATAVYDGRAETARVRGTDVRDPLAVSLRARQGGGTDTTLVRAPRIDAARVPAGADTSDEGDGEATLTVLTAAGGVRLWSRRLAAVTDSLRLVRTPASGARPARDALSLRGAARPRAWADGAQITADSLDADALAEALDVLRAGGRAFAARADSAAGRLQQIAGGQMLGRFVRDSLRTLSVWPTAEVVAWRVDGDGRLAGAERLSADSLAIRLVGGEIREVAGIGGVAGTSFPPTAPPDDARLPGFAFDPDARPRPEALLDGWEAERLRAWDEPPPAAPELPPDG